VGHRLIVPLAAAAVAVLAAIPAAAELPAPSRLSWPAADGQGAHSLTLEFSAVAVLGADRTTGYPELGRLFGGEPEMMRLRVGGVGDFGRVGYAARIDLAETLRLELDQVRFFPVASANRLLDDFYGLWRPIPTLAITAGRQRIGVSRFRDIEPGLLAAGTTPFTVDRALPDRRWGLRARARFGRFFAGAGGWLDGDTIEPRVVPGDPAFGTRALVSAAIGWVALGGDTEHWLPTRPEAEDDDLGEPPWPEPRLVVRIAPLVRFEDDGDARVDAAAGVEGSWRGFGGLAELLVLDGDLGFAGEGEIAVHSKASVFVRGELDGERRLWSSGAGVTYFATADRRNRIAFYGWIRRDLEDAPGRDGAVIQLQATL
jgi:hypothetical protein